MVEALGHLVEEIPEQRGVDGPPFLVRTEDARKEEVPGRLIDALDEMVEARGRGERREQVFLARQGVEESPHGVERQIEQAVLGEVAWVDPVRDARRAQLANAELALEPGRVCGGRLQRRALHRHHDVLQLGEVAAIVLVERRPWLVRWKELELRGVEREEPGGVAVAQHGEQHSERHGQPRTRAAAPDQALQDAAGESHGQRAARGASSGPANSAWFDLSLATRLS